MSLTVVSFGAAVRIGGEYDDDGQRGFVLLACEPTPCLLTRRAARDVARALARSAERVRPAREAANRARSDSAKEQHKTSNPRKGEKSGAASRDAGPKRGGPHHAARALAAASHTSRATGARGRKMCDLS